MVDLRLAPAVVQTARLVLRESDPSFAPAFAEAIEASAAELGFVAGWRAARDVTVAERSLQRSLELADVDVVRHAFEQSTGSYVGRFDLHSWHDQAPRCELGYLLDSRLSGAGLATEAAGAMLDVAWVLGAARVQAMCDVRNVRAVRLAERIGMVREGILRSYERDSDGRLCDQVVLAVVRPDTTVTR